MIMPDRQQSQHARREGAMHGQMGPDNTMPILHGTTGSHGLLPHVQQSLSLFSPCRIQALHQVLDGWTQHGTALPCPRHQAHGLWSHSLACLLLRVIEIGRKAHQVRKCQPQLLAQRLDLLLQGGRRLLGHFLPQNQQGFQFLFTLSAVQDPGLPKHHDLQQAVQFLREIADGLRHIPDLGDALLVFSDVGQGARPRAFLPWATRSACR